MTDRERVLMNIAVDTAGTVHDTMERLAHGWQLRFRFGNPAPQFIPTELAERIEMPIKPGDIVRCCTNPNHSWGISELIEQTGHSDFRLKLIGGDRILNMGNESVDVLRFMEPSRLYTGAKHRIYQWASTKAFSERYNPHADYYKRCGKVEFVGDTLNVWSRAHIWAQERKGGLHAQPKKFSMPWNEKTKLKDIVDAMIEQGFAEDFEYAAKEPTEGNQGFAKFTRESLLSSLRGR